MGLVRSLVGIAIAMAVAAPALAGVAKFYEWFTEPGPHLERVDSLGAKVATMAIVLLGPLGVAVLDLVIARALKGHTGVALGTATVAAVTALATLAAFMSAVNGCNIGDSFPIPGARC